MVVNFCWLLVETPKMPHIRLAWSKNTVRYLEILNNGSWHTAVTQQNLRIKLDFIWSWVITLTWVPHVWTPWCTQFTNQQLVKMNSFFFFWQISYCLWFSVLAMGLNLWKFSFTEQKQTRRSREWHMKVLKQKGTSKYHKLCINKMTILYVWTWVQPWTSWPVMLGKQSNGLSGDVDSQVRVTPKFINSFKKSKAKPMYVFPC